MANGSDGSITFDTSLDTTGFSKGSEKLKSAIAGIVKTANNVGKQMGNAIQGAIPSIKQVGDAIQQTDNVMNSSTFGKYVGSMESSCASLATQFQKLGTKASDGFKDDKAITAYISQIEKAEQSIQSARERLAELGKQQVTTTAYETLEREATETYARLRALEARQQQLEALGTKKKSATWRRLQMQIASVTAELDKYSQRSNAMLDSGQAMSMGADSAQYKQVAASLDIMAEAAQRYRAAAEQARAETQAVGQSGGIFRTFGKALKDTAVTAMGFVKTLARISFNGLKTGASAAGKAFKSIGSFAKGAIKNLLSFNKTSKKTALSSKGLIRSLTSLKRMLISRVKEFFITQIFRSMKEAVNGLAKYSKEFDASMSMMKNSMKGFGGNVAVTFGNLVNAIAPAITAIIDMLSRAVTYINAFFALLSGKSSMIVAKKQTDSYASSLGGAAGAAKELKNEVYGFDELNKATGENDSGGGGSGAGMGEFETVPLDSIVPQDMLVYFDSIKAAIVAQDWEGVGELVADGLNNCIYAVDNWIVSVESEATRWTSNIARVLNGVVSGLDWNALGSMVGAGLNTISNVVGTFFTTFNFSAFGAGLSQGINGAISRINWAQAGATLASMGSALPRTLYALVSGIDWIMLGTSLSTGINSWLANLDWTSAILFVTTGFNGVVAALGTAITLVDWAGMGTTLAGNINLFFASVDWASYGAVLSDGVKGALTFINTALMETDWQAIGNNVATFLAAVDWSGIATSLSTGIGAALGGIAAFLWGALQGAWEATKAYFGEYFEMYGGDIIAGLLAGIVNAIKSIGQWIIDNIFNPFINGFKAAFGINSPSTVMEELGGYIIEGMLNGLTTAWTTISTWLSTSTTEFTAYFSDMWETITTGVNDTWTSITTTLSDTWTNIKTTATTKWTEISTDLSTKWDDIKTTASEKWETLKTTVIDLFTGARDDAKAVEWKDVGEGITTGTESGIIGLWASFKSRVVQRFKNLVQGVKNTLGINSPSKVFASIGDFMMQGLQNGVDDGAPGAVKAVSNVATAVTDAMALDDTTVGYQVESGLMTAAQAFSGIVDKLHAVAEICASASFQLPQISAGTVVPYKVKTIDTDAPDGQFAALQGMQTSMSDQIEMLEAVYTLLRELLDAVKNKRIPIDIVKLSRAVSTQQYNDKRNFGGAY